MKSIFSSAILVLLVACNCFAQNNSLDWVRSAGSQNFETGEAIAIDPLGNVVVAGNFMNTVDFDPGNGTANLTSAGDDDIFILKLDPSGNFIWVVRLGGTDSDLLNSMALDPSGNVLITGYFKDSCDLDPGTGTDMHYAAGGSGDQDIYIVKLDPAGNHIWSHSFGSTDQDQGKSITTDALGNIYATGNYRLSVDFDPGSGVANLTTAGLLDVYILKLDAAGNYVLSAGIGGGFNDNALTISVDNVNSIYVGGNFEGSCDFDPGAGTASLNSSGDDDAYIVKLDSAGLYCWAKKFGGSDADFIQSILADAAGMIYLTGSFKNTIDLNPGTGSTSVASQGASDFFVVKMDTAGNFQWGKSIGSLGNDIAFDLWIHNNNTQLLLTGKFRDDVDFDPGTGTALLSGFGSDDIFIVNLDTSSNHIWSKQFGGNSSEMGLSLTTDASGKIYATGFFTGQCDFDPNSGTVNVNVAGGSDLFVLKLGPTGVGIDETISVSDIMVYPSPFDEAFYITFPDPATSGPHKNTTVQITDVTGRNVYRKIYSETGFLQVAPNLSSGMYYVTVITPFSISTYPLVKR
jgi:Secretion system C-terminal sorting domain/Beta-propeller repeat